MPEPDLSLHPRSGTFTNIGSFFRALDIMIRRFLTTSIGAAIALIAALGVSGAPSSLAAADSVESGRFVWHDLMTRDVSAAKQFYGALFGWRFEDTKRSGRAYVLARVGSEPVAGFVDVSAIPDAGPQWISFMSVDDVDKTVALVQSEGGKVLLEPREVPSIARAAVVADPQGAPLGLAQLRRSVPDPAQPKTSHMFWQEYLARDAAKALAFYKNLAGYESAVTDTQLGIEYHVLRKTRGRAGLFQLPDTNKDVEPNWLPYVLVNDPAGLAAKVPGLGGRVLVPAAPDLRNGSLVVIADPGGAPLALQKYPF
jgi:predicted enzyme related to lactoylglutathione lyase